MATKEKSSGELPNGTKEAETAAIIHRKAAPATSGDMGPTVSGTPAKSMKRKLSAVGPNSSGLSASPASALTGSANKNNKSASGASVLNTGVSAMPGSATTAGTNPGSSSCRYDTSLGLLTKRFINLIESAEEGTLDLNKGTNAFGPNSSRSCHALVCLVPQRPGSTHRRGCGTHILLPLCFFVCVCAL